jgi:hypothetical protein
VRIKKKGKMFFYVDESGQTGFNLFDEQQPNLYYGTLSSRLNLDIRAQNHVLRMREILGVKRLHAAEIGNGRLINIAYILEDLSNKLNLQFDFYILKKTDFAVMSFFDQIFDEGINPAVPWTAYWTPLRYLLLSKLAYLTDVDLLKKTVLRRLMWNS